jgi:hypothetical protein
VAEGMTGYVTKRPAIGRDPSSPFSMILTHSSQGCKGKSNEFAVPERSIKYGKGDEKHRRLHEVGTWENEVRSERSCRGDHRD